MEEHLVFAWNHAEIERLRVDGELVLAELDDVLAIDVEFVAVLQLADGILTDRLQLRLDVVGFNAVT